MFDFSLLAASARASLDWLHDKIAPSVGQL
jgi:hypothetical protein